MNTKWLVWGLLLVGCATLEQPPRPGEIEARLARRRTYLAAHPEIPQEMRMRIERCMSEPGMTKEQILVIEDRVPDRQWVQNGEDIWEYRRKIRIYYHFRNGILQEVTGSEGLDAAQVKAQQGEFRNSGEFR